MTLLLLIATLALADEDAVEAEPTPPPLRCSVDFESADGKGTVWGIGADEAEARAQAESHAWTVASLQLGRWMWADLLGWQKSRIDKRFEAWVGDNPVDQVKLEPRGCEELTLHDPGWPRAWVATAGGATAVRADPVVAARAARREGCFGAYEDRWSDALDKASEAAGRLRVRHLTDGADEASEALLGCLAELPTLTRQGALTPVAAYTNDRYRCVGLGSAGDPLMAGEASSLERAREAARQQGTALEPRFALARGLRVLAERPDATAEVLAAARTVASAPPVDLTCHHLADAGVPRWSKASETELCRAGGVALPQDRGSIADHCWAVQKPLIDSAHALIVEAEPEQHTRLAAEAWSQAFACEAACRAGARDSSRMREVHLAGEK